MLEIDEIRRLFEYDYWANREVLNTLRALPAAPEKSMKLFAHIVAVEWLWLARARNDSSNLIVWPESDLMESERQLHGSREAWAHFLQNLTAQALSESVNYLNSKGEGWRNDIRDILLQVVLHSAAHRGQIATDLRQAGFEPPYVDFIHAVRRGFIR